MTQEKMSFEAIEIERQEEREEKQEIPQQFAMNSKEGSDNNGSR
jgi:hypothetical protein